MLPEGSARIRQVVSGNSHSVALDYAGNVFVWGNDQKGQLGTGYHTVNDTGIDITRTRESRKS